MRIRARAALLCAALVSLAAAPAATATEIYPGHVMSGTHWPSTSNNAPVPAPATPIVSDGVCDADGNGHFTFSRSGPGMLLLADGTFSEQGSFTIGKVDGTLRVTHFESTVSGSSSRASVTGSRRMRPEFVGETEVECFGTQAERHEVRIVVRHAHTLNEITFPDGTVLHDRGFAFVHIGKYQLFNGGWQPGSFYSTHFSSDQDDDGYAYHEDNCARHANPDQLDTDGDRAGNTCDGDDDNDGRSDARDNCALVPNLNQADKDADGIGDVCDGSDDSVKDADGDGVIDTADNCVSVPNADQQDTGGGPAGDACEDRDGDGTGDLVDNCVDLGNADQSDADADRIGDACDPDDDGDAVADAADNCPTVANTSQRDSDADGSGDECDGRFDSTDGKASGGGKIGSASFSFSAHSFDEKRLGSGRLVDGDTVVRLLDVSGLYSNGSRAVVVGTASIGGATAPYRLEVVDNHVSGGHEPDTFELEVGERRWAGALTNGNVVVH